MAEPEEAIKFQPKALLIKTAVALLVLLTGAAVFMKLEWRETGNTNPELSSAVKSKRLLAAKYNISHEDLVELQTNIKREADEQDQQESSTRWTYSTSVFFTFTIMTTIGYGHMTPQTWQGQLFCIFFSLIAIPVAGLMLISVGNHVSLSIRIFLRFMEKTFLCSVVSVSAEMKSFIVTFILMLLTIVFGAILTSHTDDWAFIEGAYFIFISVSTIGFGDYVVNDGQLKSNDHSKTMAVNFTIVLITLGLCVVSSVLCCVSAVIEERQKRMRISLQNAASAMNSVTNNLPLKASRKAKGEEQENPSVNV